MEIIKKINKLITKKILEILIVTAFVFLSLPLWDHFEKQNAFALASAYSTTNYLSLDIENPINYSMYPMTDDFAMQKLGPCHLKVINDTLTNENYVLYLTIAKNSTIDYHYLKISINNQIHFLENLITKTDTNNYYFALDQDSLLGDAKNYEIKLWLDEKTGDEMQNKELIMSFETKNSVAKM